MLQLSLDRPANAPLRILCLGAHSDDIEIGCGGTILKLVEAREDLDIRWVVFSGTANRAVEASRSAEAVLKRVSHKKILIESFRDGFFPFVGGQIKEYFESIKTDFEPDLIFTHFRDDLHQDHRLISQLTWNTFRSHFILEYEIPKYDGDMRSPNAYVTLSESTCRRKVAALVKHFGSQRPKHWFSEDLFVGLLRIRGMECSSPTGYAEGFYCRKARLF